MASSQLIDDDENGNEEEQPPLQEGKKEHWASIEVIQGKSGSGRGKSGNSGEHLPIHLITSALKNDAMLPSHQSTVETE